MIDFEKLYTVFGEELPVHSSDFFSNQANPTLLADLKIYNTANKVLAYNILKAKYKEFVSTKKESSVADKLAAIKSKKQPAKEIITK